jgi:hypothetical protein
MSLFLLIGSWRVRAFLLWLAHWPALAITPLAGLGLRLVFGWSIPAWTPSAAGWITLALVLATLAGTRLHHVIEEETA